VQFLAIWLTTKIVLSSMCAAYVCFCVHFVVYCRERMPLGRAVAGCVECQVGAEGQANQSQRVRGKMLTQYQQLADDCINVECRLYHN